ncbi:DUF4292 domain-containing protein [Flavobacterium cellulosilyticum]|uniref:DUF4292 domain-containing protein n=1 Tax=Flavobacterium cellulosilyticum TaxID=2541731 RepID=A0A4R5CK51_9FLAO|nr:DUF4292 domain-containing protein [Flavobacterium cellulosilyticum]TDD99546.1 DUF4292 domain-containing protein [Flavobacterium cellulosilyticum]
MYKIFKVMVVVFGICSLTLVSCKSKAVLLTTTPTVTAIKAKNIIENHYNNKTDFSTLYIKSRVRFQNEKQSQNVTAEIRIKKDEQILISIRFLGITMAKALITPTSVSYYEKMGGSYYEGDFSKLSEFLGTDLDYNKFQNILLGQAIDDLKQGKYKESIIDGLYRLDNALDNNTKKSFYLDAEKFLIQKQEISQIAEGRMIQVAYSNNKDLDGLNIPFTINIDAYQKGSKTELNFDFDTVNINEELSFPYSVPNGYKRIIIK